MAKSTLDTSKLLGKKKEINKTTPADIEKAVKKIHEPMAEKEANVRITYDVPKSKHKAIKSKMLEKDIPTLSQYLNELVDRDLAKK